MHKFSVKKPMTIFVAVIAVLVLGIVAYFKMTPDLLPNMDFPYVIVVTTYPGASPEKVEAEISKPMEQAMSTLEHIKEVSSTSAENVSTVLLEFEESVNMDTIGVDIQQQIVTLSGSWDAMVGTPYVLKINPSMLPVEVAAVSMTGKDTIQLTEFLDDTLMNKLEGIPGVARITATGMVQQELHVILDQQLIDRANQKVMDAINDKLDDAAQELQDQKEELEASKEELEDAQAQLEDGANALIQGDAKLKAEKKKLLEAQKKLQEGIATLQSAYDSMKSLQNTVKDLENKQAQAQKSLEGLKSLKALGQAIQTMQAQVTQLQQEIAQLESQPDSEDPAVNQQRDQLLAEKQAQLAQLQAELAARQAAYNAALASSGLTEAGIDSAIAELEAALVQIEEALAQVDAQLAAQGMTRQSLDTTVQELAAQLEELKTTLSQLENGLLTLEQAQATLEKEKIKGMLQMSTAAGQLAAGTSSIEMALQQIESGFDTLEDSREDALNQADLNQIITMDMVSQILTAQNFSMPAGYVQQEDVSYMVSIGDEITELETLQNLLLFDLGLENVDPIYLSDVAVVTLTDNRDETYAKLDTQDGVMLSFEKQSTSATAETTKNIAKRFRQLEKEYPGLRFVALMDQGDYIYMVVESILKNIFLGALFSVLILFLFLRDIRPTFITLCSIPISVIFAIVLMYFTGVSLNMISLSALAIAVGMLVDNSVVVIENIYRLRAKGANVIQAAVSGAGQVLGAVTASTLTTVCVFVPIVFVEGITRQLFMDLALTMSYALIASLIVSLTLVPAMASGILRKDRPIHASKLGSWLMKAYDTTVKWALKYKLAVLLLALVLLVGTGIASVSKGFIFMPEMDSPMVTVSITMPEATDMEQAAAVSDAVLERIIQVEGVDTVGAMMEAGNILTAGVPTTSYQVTAYVTLKSDKMSGAEVGKRIEAACQDMDCTVSATSAMMDMSMLTGSGVSMNIFADDMDALQNAARTAGDILSRLEGIAEVSNGLEDAAPALHVDIDRNEAMKNGLTVAQVYMELAAGLTADGTVASLELDGISTDVIIEKPEGAVLDAQELREYVFEVTDQEGQTKQVPLSDFARVEETTSLTTISRVNQRRYLTVTAQLEDGYNVTLITNKAEAAIRKADLGKDVTYSFTGENEMIMEAVEQLLLMLLLGMVLVYLVMVAQFQSLKSPFIVMFTIPLAFTGGFMALLLCGMEVSIIALVGFVMLMGVIVNNGIVLVDYINQLRLEGMERREAIVEAGKTRMRPIMMTTLTTVLGQLVMAVSQDAGSIMMRPIAVVSIGGLLYATLMTLYVVPCIYDMMNKKDLRKIDEKDLEILDI